MTDTRLPYIDKDTSWFCRRVDALNIIEDSIINLNEATNKLKSDMDNQIEEAEANKQALQTEADEIVQLWQEVKSHRHYVNPDEKVAEPTTHLESVSN